jgi:hypothetical protein
MHGKTAGRPPEEPGTTGFGEHRDDHGFSIHPIVFDHRFHTFVAFPNAAFIISKSKGSVHRKRAWYTHRETNSK